jgi:nitrile hydratase subunit alpha
VTNGNDHDEMASRAEAGHPHHPTPPAPIERRVAALEELFVERGWVTPEAIDHFVKMYEDDIGPLNGARVIARAWVDPDYKRRLIEDGTAAIAELGFGGPEAGHLIVVENTDEVHNVIVCTLCSCYPWAVLGLPPEWYKSPPYRSRMVREPRVLLGEMGCDVADDVEVRVWDSSAEARYLVLPQRPGDSDDLTEEALVERVTRDGMIGVARL